MIWFTADHHFGHNNIIKFCNRPFDSIEEMNQTLITNWNSVITHRDDVYVLGDVVLGDIKTLQSYLSRLLGNIYIIPGGHDKWMREPLPEIESYGIDLLCPLVTITIEKQPIVLCHYAMRVWDRSHYGSLHFYGHSHGGLSWYKNSLDVGVDNAKKLLGEYRPFSFEEAIYFAKGE